MGPSPETCQLYLTALHQGMEPDDAPDEEAGLSLIEACRRDGLSPSRIVAMHAQLCAELDGLDNPAFFLRTLRVLQRVMEGVQPDIRRIAHDLRNSMQVVTGSLSLLERDFKRNGGQRALEIIERSQGHAQELSRRIEKMADGYSDLRSQ